MPAEAIRIGGASGFWGDAARATGQLLSYPELDFLVYDYLAEITMSIMARARAADPAAGYAVDFVTAAMAPHLKQIEAQGVRVVANAGGVNPQACARALEQAIEQSGCRLKVACVIGDDLLASKSRLSEQQITEMFSGESMPAAQAILSINAYLGAFGIARALDMGADLVVTGRCVDSAVTLAVCIHRFGWQRDQLDLLAMGSLAGHILECGTQATGGNFTDWRALAEDIDTLGYPVVEVSADGSFVCSKPDHTGGLVSIGTVAEQMLYEIGDPQAYLLPDVSCDFSGVTLTQISQNRVQVSGARGRPPPTHYKVSVTWADQYRGGSLMTYYGVDAEDKARAQARAILRAARRALREAGLADFTETSVELIGAESQYGAFRQSPKSRELVLKVAVKHPAPAGVETLLREAVGLGLATPPGLSGFQGGRPRPSPVVRLFSFLLEKSAVAVMIEMEGSSVTVREPPPVAQARPIRNPVLPPGVAAPDNPVTVPLIALAWGRSGDKGNAANIGIIARRPEFLPFIAAGLTESVVADRLAHFLESAPAAGGQRVERFYLPGSHALNFLVHNVLGGGGVASLRNDPQAKGYAQLLLEVPITIPGSLADRIEGTQPEMSQ